MCVILAVQYCNTAGGVFECVAAVEHSNKANMYLFLV